MTDIAGFVDTRPATRLANAIGTVKAVLLVLTALGTVVSLLNTDGSGFVFVLFSGAIALASVYVVFGWFEHTLRLLVGIAFNTAAGADVLPDLEA